MYIGIVQIFGQLYNCGMNKNRLLKLIEILRKNTDLNHKLKINEIITLLEESGINVANRKTLYDDFKILAEYGFDVEYDNGYYLLEAPFSLSEIKIIVDSINSLKNLDDNFVKSINNKLYSFISTYETKQLKKLEYHNKHKDKYFINRLEDSLYAINNNKTIIIKRNNKEAEEIAPIYLYRQNDYYYLYYHYLSNDRIYHTRFDNIVDIKLTDNDNNISIPISKIVEHINESTSAFYFKKTKTIKLEIINDSQYLRSRLSDDFANIVFTTNGFSIKASVNNAFFSKLTSYGDDIKISDKDIADQYIDYLNKIIIRNSQDHSNS